MQGSRLERSFRDLPPSVSFERGFEAHPVPIEALAWSGDGRTIASYSRDDGLSLWNVAEDKTITHAGTIYAPVGYRISIEADGQTVRLVDTSNRGYVIARTTAGLTIVGTRSDIAFLLGAGGGTEVAITRDGAVSVSVHGNLKPVPAQLQAGASFTAATVNRAGSLLALANSVGKVDVWRLGDTTERIASWEHGGGAVRTLTFSRDSGVLVSGGDDCQLALWSITRNALLRTVEGDGYGIVQLTYVTDRLLASRDIYGNVRVTDASTGASLPISGTPNSPEKQFIASIAASDDNERLAVAVHGFNKESADAAYIELWDLDIPSLVAKATASTVAYASAKVVLLGDSGVGKTGLGWRLAHGEFREHPSTHGQQFWVLADLAVTRPDKTECETVLWDLAGQPDYRLIHALFVDDAEVALLVFDAARDDDPLRSVEYWLKQLTRRVTTGRMVEPIKTILVSGRNDRGDAHLTATEIDAFCKSRGLSAYVSTSALRGDGLEQLIGQLRQALDWESKPVTVTTAAFKALKDQLLGLKEQPITNVIVEFSELADMLRASTDREFSTREVTNVVDHLARHGYVARLRTSQGALRLLLAPELLNNLAASLVLEARSNPRGLGSLEEGALWARDYRLPELEGLSQGDQDVLLDSAIVMFLEHSICFRETDPLSGRRYLVFPELINMRRPDPRTHDEADRGPSYVITGATENVYASLVVLLGYTNTFVRANQWRNHAEYIVGDDLRCGFVLEAEDNGRLEIELYFDHGVAVHVRDLFSRLIESFLAGRDLVVVRFAPLECRGRHRINRADVVQRVEEGESNVFCMRCGDQVEIGGAGVTLDLSVAEMANLDERGLAAQRSQFEQEMFRLASALRDLSVGSPKVFISYAWGDSALEQWVEHTLARDLANLGVTVLLDRWENARVGSSVARFVDEVARADSVIVIGTVGYQRKYENGDPMRGFVVAAEGDLIGGRMIGTEEEKEAVLPVLREGDPSQAFPPLLRGRVYADFRDPARYFTAFWELAGAVYRSVDSIQGTELKRRMLRSSESGSTWDRFFMSLVYPYQRLGSEEREID